MEKKMTPANMPLVLVEKWRTATWHIEDAQNNLIAECKEESEASQLLNAINFTYGKGIDPSSVPELVEAMKEMLQCFDAEGGWISDACLIRCKNALTKSIIKQ